MRMSISEFLDEERKLEAIVEEYSSLLLKTKENTILRQSQSRAAWESLRLA